MKTDTGRFHISLPLLIVGFLGFLETSKAFLAALVAFSVSILYVCWTMKIDKLCLFVFIEG